MNEKQVLARIDHVSDALEKADPEDLGKAIRLLDAMRQIAVGKKWVSAIGEADAWSLRARRRAGELVEATQQGKQTPRPAPRGSHGRLLGPGNVPSPRAEIREELGITEHESKNWQALARVPKPVFEEYVEKVRLREEEPTVSGVLSAARAAEGKPETHVTVRRSFDQIALDNLTDATKTIIEASAFEVLEEIQNPEVMATALELISSTIEYLKRQIERLAPMKKVKE